MTVIDQNIIAQLVGITLPDWSQMPDFSAVAVTYQGVKDHQHYVIRFTEQGVTAFVQGDIGLTSLQEALEQLGRTVDLIPAEGRTFHNPIPDVEKVVGAAAEWGFPAPIRPSDNPNLLIWSDGPVTLQLAVAPEGGKVLALVTREGQHEPIFATEGSLLHSLRYLNAAWGEAGFEPITPRLSVLDGQAASRAAHPSNQDGQ